MLLLVLCRSRADFRMVVVASQIANFMGPTWVLSAPDGPMNLAIRVTQDTMMDVGIFCMRVVSKS